METCKYKITSNSEKFKARDLEKKHNDYFIMNSKWRICFLNILREKCAYNVFAIDNFNKNI